MSNTITVDANYYQQFDADITLDVPGEAYGGWQRGPIEISADHTAVVVMHAWNHGPAEEFPGWYRAVEYIGRSHQICRAVFPPLLAAVRQSPLPLYHVVGGGDYYAQCPGYEIAKQLAEPLAKPQPVESDPALDKLRQFRADNVFVGAHNRPDIDRGFDCVGFPPEAEPVGDEPVCEDAEQLLGVCRRDGVNHLIYAGFAINWCLMASPGGMLDMSRRGLMCSAIRQAVTAVESKESARLELAKQIALWRVAVGFGFVFDADALAAGITSG